MSLIYYTQLLGKTTGISSESIVNYKGRRAIYFVRRTYGGYQTIIPGWIIGRASFSEPGEEIKIEPIRTREKRTTLCTRLKIEQAHFWTENGAEEFHVQSREKNQFPPS